MNKKKYILIKFSHIITFFLIFLIFNMLNNIILAQEFKEVGLSSGNIEEITTNTNLNTNGKNIIKFGIPRESHINISLFDEYGNLVKLLLYDNIQPGIYEYNMSNQLPNGKYVCRLKSGDLSETKDLVLE